MLRPTLEPVQARARARPRLGRGEFLDGFLALETWGNDNVSFPGACYRRYIEELYQRNALVRGELTLSGQPGAPRRHRLPRARGHVRARQHRPAGRARRALLDHIASADKQHLHLPGGHVGAVVSKSAKTRLWPELTTFWETRDGVTLAAAAEE